MAGKRDENNTIVAMGVSSVDGVTPVPLTVTASGRLRCVQNSSDGGNAAPDRENARFDGNNSKTMLAEQEDGTRTPLTTHNGALMVEGE